jgi:multisubunit Na+/H+ antiporter MnhC subunit
MVKKFDWSLIPYPKFRAFTIFNAFVLTSISVGIVTAISIEVQDYFVREEVGRVSFERLERENNISGVHYPGDNIKKITTTDQDPYNYRMAVHRAFRVSIASAIISMIVYLLMFTLVGFGGGMVSPKHKWGLFTSMPN